jgi:DNA-binding transcriptional MerR regulator
VDLSLKTVIVNNTTDDILSLPDQRYYTIGEVSKFCDVRPHVLRYWEQEFSHLRPVKRRGNRRYYRYKDLVLVQRIKTLLYEQGYTIPGARAQLNKEQKAKQANPVDKQVASPGLIAQLEKVLSILES